jgi:hypothetical protein
MADFDPRDTEEAAKSSTFAAGLGTIGGGTTLAICSHFGLDHLHGGVLALGVFKVLSALGRRLDKWRRS